MLWRLVWVPGRKWFHSQDRKQGKSCWDQKAIPGSRRISGLSYSHRGWLCNWRTCTGCWNWKIALREACCNRHCSCRHAGRITRNGNWGIWVWTIWCSNFWSGWNDFNIFKLPIRSIFVWFLTWWDCLKRQSLFSFIIWKSKKMDTCCKKIKNVRLAELPPWQYCEPYRANLTQFSFYSYLSI